MYSDILFALETKSTDPTKEYSPMTIKVCINSKVIFLPFIDPNHVIILSLRQRLRNLKSTLANVKR